MVPPFEDFKHAVTHGGESALWVSSVGKGKIAGIQYTVRPEEIDMEPYRKEKISKCITPSLAEEHTRDTKGRISEEVMRKIAVSI